MTLERKKDREALDLFVIFILLSILALGIIWWVTSSIKEHHLQDDPKLHQLKEMLAPLHPVVKNLKLYKGKKSYTINKEKIYLCLKDQNDNYYSNNMLIYVLLHELAHLLNKEDIGHTEKFHEIFEGLIEKAHDLGIYNTSIPPVEDYCMHNPE